MKLASYHFEGNDDVGELAVVIGKRGRDIPMEDALASCRGLLLLQQPSAGGTAGRSPIERHGEEGVHGRWAQRLEESVREMVFWETPAHCTSSVAPRSQLRSSGTTRMQPE